MKTELYIITFILILALLSCSKKTTEPYNNTVATPTLGLSSGQYLPAQELSISCSTDDAVIRYTLDGTTPTTHSVVYSQPLVVDSTLTVKAIAWKSGWNHSAVASGLFNIYHPGWSEQIHFSNISATPDTIEADNGITSSTITVQVNDYENFHVTNQSVQFITNLGNITTSAVTDSTGKARATLTAGSLSGVASITATISKYHPDYPDFLVSADTSNIDVTILEPSIE